MGWHFLLARSLETFKMNICCICETRMLDSTSIITCSSSDTTYFCFYFCAPADPVSSACVLLGFGDAVSIRVYSALFDRGPVNTRLCAVRVSNSSRANSSQLNRRCLFIIFTYVSTGWGFREAEVGFFQDLSRLIRSMRATGIVFVSDVCLLSHRCWRE